MLPGPWKGCWLRRWTGLPRTRTPGTRKAQAARACGWGPRGGSDAGVPVTAAGSVPSEPRTLRSSQKEFRPPKGRTPASRAPSAALPAGGPQPRSEAEPERPTADPCPPCGPPPRPAPPAARHRPLSARTCRCLRPPALAGYCAVLPPRRSSMALPAALRPAPTQPIEPATRRRLASRAPSHRGGAPWRGRPLLQATAVLATNEPGADSIGTQYSSL